MARTGVEIDKAFEPTFFFGGCRFKKSVSLLSLSVPLLQQRQHSLYIWQSKAEQHASAIYLLQQAARPHDYITQVGLTGEQPAGRFPRITEAVDNLIRAAQV